MTHVTAEEQRLREAREGVPWRRWGPYLSERQWGTVREDYSDDGDAWAYFTHDQARSRAYRWGEDGIAGVCDDQQRLCLGLALWNGADPILKERLFGLTNAEGNHGEDVKEYYFYVDDTADPLLHALAATSTRRRRSRTTTWSRPTRARGRDEMEYELIDTGVFDDDRYFDIEVEYAKAAPDDLRHAHHRAQPRPDLDAPLAPAPDAVVPQHVVVGPHAGAARRWRRPAPARSSPIAPALGSTGCTRRAGAELLFCENETNPERLLGTPNESAPTSRTASTTASCTGEPPRSTPASAARRWPRTGRSIVPAGGDGALLVRLDQDAPRRGADALGPDFDAARRPQRRAEADEFYESITPAALDADTVDVHAPGAGRDDLVQAVLRVRRRPLAAGARRRTRCARRAAAPAQPAVVAHAQPRRALDAGHLGVPLVRRVGPGLPRAAARHGRPRLRQGAAGPDAVATPTCTRPGRSRPTSGTSAT